MTLRDLFLPGLLETGPVLERIFAVRDGVVNFFVVRGTDGLICIDAGWRRSGVLRGFKALGFDPRDVAAIFLTHLHWDHARGAAHFPNARLYVGKGETSVREKDRLRFSPVWHFLADGQAVTEVGLTVRALAMTGHTRGSTAYGVEERFWFTGDALCLRRGRALPMPARLNADIGAARDSLRRLAATEGIACLLTAHSGVTGNIDEALQRWRATPAIASDEGGVTG